MVKPALARMLSISVPYDGANGKTFVVGQDGLPVLVRRCFLLCGVPLGVVRGDHAHRTCHQILIAVAGDWEVEVDDGTDVIKFVMKPGLSALWVPPMNWIKARNTSGWSGAIQLVLASEAYSAEDYVRTRPEWLALLDLEEK